MADLNKWDSARLPSFETAARSVSPQITDLKTEIRTIDACVMGVFTCSRKLFEYSSSLVYECFVALASGAKCAKIVHIGSELFSRQTAISKDISITPHADYSIQKFLFAICASQFSVGLAQFYFLCMRELFMCNPAFGCQMSVNL